MTVKNIVKKFLDDNGYDGLFHDNDCGCLKDELCPCDQMGVDCEPGYRIPGDEDCPFYISPNREDSGDTLKE